jgi:DNA-binding beta-propeller fold protein YncE
MSLNMRMLVFRCIGMCVALIAEASCALSVSRVPMTGELGVRSLPESAVIQGTDAPDSRCASFSGERLYVGTISNYITVFNADAAGDTKPICKFQGVRGENGGMAVDRSGNLWVSEGEVPAIAVFAHAANGKNVQPVQLVEGSNTLLLPTDQAPLKGVGIDPLTGNVWVPNFDEEKGRGAYLTGFAPVANGNIAPVATIGYADMGAGEELDVPVDIKFDAEGNMFVGDVSSIEVYKPPFSDTSKPVAVFKVRPGANAWWLGFDPHGNLYAGDESNHITVFKGGLKSGGSIWRVLQCVNEFTIAIDSHGRVYMPDGIMKVEVTQSYPRTCAFARYITTKVFSKVSPFANTVGI